MALSKLEAGTALLDISPEKGISLAGYPHHLRPNTGVHDPLYAACLYLSDGQTELAIVTLDITGISKKHVQSIRKRASEQNGIPEGHILVCASHTHSAPRCTPNNNMDALKGATMNEQYASMVKDACVQVISDAVSTKFPAELGTEKGFCGREQGVGGNRRDPMGISDPEVWVIGVRDLEGRQRGVLVKYALHPTFLHSDNFFVSADYPGNIREYINGMYPEAVFLFAQGTSGNQSPRYFRSGKTFAEAKRAGHAIGKEAQRVLAQMEYTDDVPLSVKSKEVHIELRDFPDRSEAEARAEQLKQAWHALRDSGAPETDVWNAELLFLGAEDTVSMMMLYERGELAGLNDNSPMEVQVLGIGDARIVGFPGEIFVEFGITVQYRSPFPKTFVVELANGALPGYAATARAYTEGGYESWNSMLTGRSGEQLVDAAVQLLHEMS